MDQHRPHKSEQEPQHRADRREVAVPETRARRDVIENQIQIELTVIGEAAKAPIGMEAPAHSESRIVIGNDIVTLSCG